MRRDTFLKTLAALAAAGALPNAAWANANIKMMIPANPGGGWDGTGRAQGEADQQGQFGTHPAQFEDDEASILIAAAEQGLQAGQDADVTRAQQQAGDAQKQQAQGCVAQCQGSGDA